MQMYQSIEKQTFRQKTGKNMELQMRCWSRFSCCHGKISYFYHFAAIIRKFSYELAITIITAVFYFSFLKRVIYSRYSLPYD